MNGGLTSYTVYDMVSTKSSPGGWLVKHFTRFFLIYNCSVIKDTNGLERCHLNINPQESDAPG